MRKFMGEDVLLTTSTSKKLYHHYAAKCPIVDLRSGLSAKDIFVQCSYDNLTKAWLEVDDDKLNAMRRCGVDEFYITGVAADYDKFLKFAEIMPGMIGSPVYLWTHLELARCFGIHTPLDKNTAPEIWHKTGEKLAKKGHDMVSALDQLDVEVICMIADPADDLEWYLRCAHSDKVPFDVLPVFDPSRFMAIDQPAWFNAITELGRRYGVIHDWESMKSALSSSMEFFCDAGCKFAAHIPVDPEFTAGSADAIIEKAIHHGSVSEGEAENFRKLLVQFFVSEYAKKGIKVMPGTAIHTAKDIDLLMETGMLSGSVGMLTDSRSFTSFVRHEYYRRILCEKIGQLVESGQYPDDLEFLGEMVQDICWRNAVSYFNFEI